MESFQGIFIFYAILSVTKSHPKSETCIGIDISLFIGCLVETRNYSILSLAFIVSSFRVTEENLVFETVQSGKCSSFECFSALKGTHL